MKRIQRRAYSVLLLALALLFGMGLYVFRFARDGKSWAASPTNEAVYREGKVTTGTLTDRSGIILAACDDGKRTFSEDSELRIACLHLIGDREGNIGTGALTMFADRLTGYSAVTGVAPEGKTVRLSVDAALCRTAWEALAGQKGAVLLLDYTTGEILCMVSSPSFDPDTGFDADDPFYEGVYLNRCISAVYPPGSVFKLVTLAAALETIPDLKDRSFLCEGSTTVDGNIVRCSGTHGSQTIEQALANSCNCAFAALSLELGGEILKQYAEAMGLTTASTLENVETAAGRFDSAPEGSAALAWSGIGQSTDLVNPYAMLRLVSAIANGGVLHTPGLTTETAGEEIRLLSESTAAELKAMMNYNVAYSYGTWNFPGLTLCAKSGTAELGDGSSHAWFTGFLDDPENPYAFVVVIENGGGGLRAAGPVANAVLQAAIQK